MNSVTFDWLALAVILSTFAACAVVGWFAAYLMNRSKVLKPMEPVAPIVEVQQIEFTIVDQGWRRWRRTSRANAKRFQASPRKILFLLKNREQGD
jgi:hypothetical protein